MTTINERFREVRELLDLTQDDFAKKANRTRSEIKNIEYNKTSPKEEVIKAVCAAHGINRRYLELGEEPKLMPELEDDTDYINELLNELDNPFTGLIKSVMQVYLELSPADKEKAKAFAKNLSHKIKESQD